MPAGKTCPQAGHAYVDSYCAAKETHPELAAQYRDLGKGGSKVALKAKNHRELIVAWGKALDSGLPCALVVDKTHVLPPHFDGTPIITALGIGPCTKAEARHIVKKFQCL